METVKGFEDFIGEEAIKREAIRKVAVEVFEKYGFEPSETPIIEYEEFVRGPESQQGDEAISDIFKLQDKGKRKLALKYEQTFPLKRLMNNKKLPYKRYTIGPVFRDEPTSEQRLRQFTQCDADVIGSSVKNDAEVLAIINDILDYLGVKNTIFVGNRALLNEIIDEIDDIKGTNRNQVLREIDKLDKLPEAEVRKNLKKYGAEKLLDILGKSEKYFERFKAYQDIKELKEYCKFYGIEIKFQPSLVRGLSYYNRNVFEIKVKGMKETVMGGGAYMFNSVQCVGWSFSFERLIGLVTLNLVAERYLVISLDRDKEAIALAQKLRSKGGSVSVYYGKPSKALEYANSYGFQKVIFVGEKEIKSKKFMVKDMKTGKESELKI